MQNNSKVSHSNILQTKNKTKMQLKIFLLASLSTGSLLATATAIPKTNSDVRSTIHIERDDCSVSYCNNGRLQCGFNCDDSRGFTVCSYRGMAPSNCQI